MSNPSLFARTTINRGAVFSPDDLPNGLQWFDASDASTINFGIDPAVQTQEDKFASSIDITNVVAAEQPDLLTADQNGLDGLSYDGSNDSLEAPDPNEFDSLTAFTAIFVIKFNNLTGGKDWFARFNAAPNFQFAFRNDNGDPQAFLSSNGTAFMNAKTSTTPTSVGTTVIITIIYDGSETGNADRLKIFINGSEETLTFAGTVPASLPDITEDVEFVRATNNAEAETYETIIYSDAKNTSDRVVVETYANDKWVVF